MKRPALRGVFCLCERQAQKKRQPVGCRFLFRDVGCRLAVWYLNGHIKSAARPRGQADGSFVDCFGNLDSVDAWGVTDAEIQVLPVKSNTQLIVQERLGEGLVRNFWPLTENQRQGAR